MRIRHLGGYLATIIRVYYKFRRRGFYTICDTDTSGTFMFCFIRVAAGLINGAIGYGPTYIIADIFMFSIKITRSRCGMLS